MTMTNTILQSSLLRSGGAGAMLLRRMAASQRGVPTILVSRATRMLSSSTEAKTNKPPPHPDQVDPQLQVMTGYMEYLDTALAKTEKLEASVKALHEFYEERSQHHIASSDSDNQVDLVAETGKHRAELEQELASLRQMVQDVRKSSAAAFAVDAPDGETDWHVRQEMAEINHIIDDAAKMEDAAEIEEMHRQQEQDQKEARKTFAVDAPDGETDGHWQEELEEAKHVIDDAAELEDKEAILRLHRIQEQRQKEARKVFAVDAPDGEDDGHLQEELEEVKHIIDDAAELEDKEAVLRLHRLEEEEQKEARKTFAVDAPDGEDDGHLREEEEEVKHIIDDAAKLEDKEFVLRLHKEQEEARKVFAVDPPDGETDAHVLEEIEQLKQA